MKHTPGPWATKHHGEWIVGRDSQLGEVVVATARFNWEENSRLIAAAPDLLAALQLMMREYECLRFEQPERWPDAATAARAAIAKATNPENCNA